MTYDDMTDEQRRAIVDAAMDFATVADTCTRMAKATDTTAQLNALSEAVHAKHQYEDRLRETCGAIQEAHDGEKD